MTKYFIATTYDLCEHNDLYEDMNSYVLDSSVDFEEQISKYAKLDVAPLVKVYESVTSDCKKLKLYKEYTFKEYGCDCEK